MGKKTTTPVEVGGTDYEFVAASQTDQVLGGDGAPNDLLARLVVNVTTSATGTVGIKDGASGTLRTLVPANTPIGVYHVEIGARSVDGGWRITTGAGASVFAVGQFTA